MSVEIKNTDSSCIVRMGIKCGFMVIAAMVVAYLVFKYPTETKDTIKSFLVWFYEGFSLVVVFLDKLPLIPTILLCGFYGWLQCFSINLEKRKVSHKYLHIVHQAVPFFGILSYVVVVSHGFQTSLGMAAITYVVCSVILFFSASRSDKALKELKEIQKSRNDSPPAEAA